MIFDLSKTSSYLLEVPQFKTHCKDTASPIRTEYSYAGSAAYFEDRNPSNCAVCNYYLGRILKVFSFFDESLHN